jgi:hypothetical protein
MRMSMPGRTTPQIQPDRSGKGRVGKHAGPAAPKRQDARHHGAPGKAKAAPRGTRPAKDGPS